MLAVAACLMMMVFPEITVTASKSAIRIWMNAVVPSLLPFMVVAGYIKRAGVSAMTSSRFYPAVMAFFSGYPMGAKMAGDQYRDGLLDEAGLKRVLSYAMITGPAFLTGGIGVTFYQNKTAGYVLACSHYAAAAICGLILGRGTKIPEQKIHRHRGSGTMSGETPFTDSILESFRSLGIVLAYILLFMIGAAFLDISDLFQSMPDWASAFCKGLLEMTVGCSEIARCSCSLRMKLVLSSFLISFGGLSVTGQTMSMLKGCPVKPGQILTIKILHGALSAIWTFTICAFVV
ncbi:MAG: hypothetical protein IKJ77_08205 [Firmicutes bacterium]|nr:hypothetical protein [Bacillota bacterium]